MKIVHICLCGPYTDNSGYQENLITKFQKKMGYDVSVIATQWMWSNGQIVKCSKNEYFDDNGVKVYRLPIRRGDLDNRLRRYVGLMETLTSSSPDILFVHDMQFLDLLTIKAYLDLHNGIRLYIDNHCDQFNSASNVLSKYILHKCIWRSCLSQIEAKVNKYYGVLPARVEFMKSMYHLPESKCELLVMGADDDCIATSKSRNIREKIRQEKGISNEDIVLVTGGKINKNRPETINLMRAITEIKQENVKLIVFGSISAEYKDAFDRLCESKKIIYVGWISMQETYDYFEAADIAIFPGLHSVMWEQAVAQGKICMFRNLDGFHHVDLGGNVIFLSDVSTNGLNNSIRELIDSKETMINMQNIANSSKKNDFLYSIISKKCIEL